VGGVQVVGGWRGRVKGKVGVGEGLGRGWGGVGEGLGGGFAEANKAISSPNLSSPILLVLLLVPREARVPYAPKLSFFVVRNVPL
jgi:hypothetical protein